MFRNSGFHRRRLSNFIQKYIFLAPFPQIKTVNPFVPLIMAESSFGIVETHSLKKEVCVSDTVCGKSGDTEEFKDSPEPVSKEKLEPHNTKGADLKWLKETSSKFQGAPPDGMLFCLSRGGPQLLRE